MAIIKETCLAGKADCLHEVYAGKTSNVTNTAEVSPQQTGTGNNSTMSGPSAIPNCGHLQNWRKRKKKRN